MKKLYVLIGIILLALLSAFIWWNNGLSAADAKSTTHSMFIIQPGTGIRAIANDLKEEGLIKDPIVFFLMVRQKGYDKRIQAGDFRLSPSMKAEEVALAMTKGSIDIWVTIPEGKRAEEVAAILEEKLPTYDPSWEAELINNEGYLFPDTYLVPRDATIETIITLLTGTFDQRFSEIDTSNSTLSKEDLVILASMIEREARHDEDRPLIASVMYNRLDINMALQIDATIQYAKGDINGNWWSPVTLAEYKSVVSPYNTYLQPGLPPSPIANPGAESLEAAANPANSEYMYYISDENCVNRYARTGDQHQANIERYGLCT